MVGKAWDVDQVAAFADAFFITEDKEELALKNECELFFVRVHVQRRAFFVGIGHDYRLHELNDSSLYELFWVSSARLWLHFRNLLKKDIPCFLANDFNIPGESYP